MLFSYDDKNRLTEFVGGGENYIYTYSGEYVTIENLKKGPGSVLVNLNPEGYVKDFTTEGDTYFSYSYDEGCIKERKVRHSSGQITTKFTWSKGNMISIVNNEDERRNSTETINIEYNTIKNKANIDIVAYFSTMRIAQEGFMFWGLLGKSSENLVSKVEYERGGRTYIMKFSYKLDNNGYVTEVSMNINDKDSKIFVTYG